MSKIKSLVAAVALATSGLAFQPAAIAATYNDEHVEWCQRYFPSYNIVDNTVQEGRTGERQCSSPYATFDTVRDDNGTVVIDNPTYDYQALVQEGATAQSHKEWCSDAHPSYDEASNKYTGPDGIIRFCASPFS